MSELDGADITAYHYSLDGGWCVSESVTADGAMHFWLVPVDHHGFCDCNGPVDAPHEQTGPLPSSWRAAVWGEVCGRRRSSGGACRNRVAAPGEPCHWHRSAP
jgi:hypothetical protein